MAIRSPIISVLGHVDHGKTTLLDAIRNTSITKQEAGAITQSIGASLVPIDIIRSLIEKYSPIINIDLKIPGLLFIDTPGHEAFTTMRKRGGSLSDLSLVVVDINEGFKPQTIESIKILKMFKTPFIIVANKIDLIPGYVKRNDLLLKDIEEQGEDWKKRFYEKIYRIVGQLYDNFGMDSDLFNKVDFQKQVAIVPISAKTRQGISELLILAAGLAQKYLFSKLDYSTERSGRGVVIEVKDVKGVGKVLDSIIYDGHISIGDKIMYFSYSQPKISRVKALFITPPLSEIRDRKAVFKPVDRVEAAIGVRIVLQEAEDVVPGTEIRVVNNEEEKDSFLKEYKAEIDNAIIDTENDGIIIKADSLGSLEALINLLKQENIPIRKALIGNISHKDIVEAEAMIEKNPFFSVILGFNVKCEEKVPKGVGVITSNVIYQLIEKLREWNEKKKKEIELKMLSSLPSLFKLYVMPNYVFRQSNPAIFGVEVKEGKLAVKSRLMKDGIMVGEVKEIQLNRESIHMAEKNQQVAISVPNLVIGRHVKEGDYLYTYLAEEEFRTYKKMLKYLSPAEKELLKEIASIMRKTNDLWGV